MPLSHFVPASPSPSPCPQAHSLRLRLYSCPAPRFFRTIYLESLFLRTFFSQWELINSQNLFFKYPFQIFFFAILTHHFIVPGILSLSRMFKVWGRENWGAPPNSEHQPTVRRGSEALCALPIQPTPQLAAAAWESPGRPAGEAEGHTTPAHRTVRNSK